VLIDTVRLQESLQFKGCGWGRYLDCCEIGKPCWRRLSGPSPLHFARFGRSPQQDVLEHQQVVPWPNLYQVEQDLLLCRSMVAIFED